METFFYKLILFELLFILLLLLRKLGTLERIYEELYTHPSTKKILYSVGDILYAVGLSVMASVVFTLTTTTLGFFSGTFSLGLLFVSLGLYLRD